MTNQYTLRKGAFTDSMIQVLIFLAEYYTSDVHTIGHLLDGCNDIGGVLKYVSNNTLYLIKWMVFVSGLVQRAMWVILVIIAAPLIMLYTVDLIVYTIRQVMFTLTMVYPNKDLKQTQKKVLHHSL